MTDGLAQQLVADMQKKVWQMVVVGFLGGVAVGACVMQCIELVSVP